MIVPDGEPRRNRQRWRAEAASESALDDAWQDHREGLTESFPQASSGALRLLTLYPELVGREEYSPVITRCERCQDHGRFRRAPPHQIVEILGYW